MCPPNSVYKKQTAINILCGAIRTVLISCLSFSFLLENAVRSQGELAVFSTVKRTQTSISPSELCDWMPEGTNIFQTLSS